jgi:DNA-directed RNA polymerase sigma subunit (sigma70/sigma32)
MGRFARLSIALEDDEDGYVESQKSRYSATLSEIGKELGLTKQRVDQIQREAYKKFKENWEKIVEREG